MLDSAPEQILELKKAVAEGPPLGEGGQIAVDGLCTTEPQGRAPIAIIGGTGYVGRLLARRLLSHPTLCLGPIVGSKRSEGMLYQEVWEEKESALMKNYGKELWSAMPFPPALAGVKVASLESLLESDCRLAISCVAPDVGYIEDILTNGRIKVYSISPYKRSENLTVPEVNPSQIPYAKDKMLFKSPNCVSVGVSLALKAIDDAFGLDQVSVCTFQSLSGRGDAMYPPELVQGNIYPVWNTKERTEVYIGNEICALVNLNPTDLTVRAHRVGVHIGHFADVRVRVRQTELLATAESVFEAFEAFAPLSELYGPEMPSLPEKPLKVIREVGAPRPATHNMEHGGMQVAVGNVKLEDGVWDICFSVVVNNMIRGAYGAALLMAEYHSYVERHPAACERLIAHHRHLDSVPAIATGASPEPPPTSESPAAVFGASVSLPAQTPKASVNKLTNRATVTSAREACEADPGLFHGELAKRLLHWYHPGKGAWLSWNSERAAWSGWKTDCSECELSEPWAPWSTALDESKAPYFEWFVGGLTNAAFNEVDRHVLTGHGDETALVCVGPDDVKAAVGDGGLAASCSRLTRKQLLLTSAVHAEVLRECGIGAGDTVVMMLPHCADQVCWIEAAKRIGAIYTCLPESMTIANIAGRLFETQAKVVITSSAKSSVESGTSHRAMVSHAVMEYVSMEAALRAVRRVLPEQRWRSQHGKVDVRAVCDALESSFYGDGAVSPKEAASKLQIVFSMHPPLREKATQLATYLMDEMKREHAARVRTKLLVVPAPFTKPAAAPAPAASPSTDRRMSYPASAGRLGSNKTIEMSAQLGALVLMAEDLREKVLPRFLSVAGVESCDELLELSDVAMVAAVWKASAPKPLSSMAPKNVVYTSGSSGYKATGLVHDVGGYTSGVASTMHTVFDARPGEDAIFTVASPSWVTGQSYGITGPLTCRVTSVIVSSLPEGQLAHFLAGVVKQLRVTIFVASASFLKRALSTTWQAAWLQRQRLCEQLRVAASCGEPLSPAIHKLGMAVLCPNYINSYWASEHGAIILGHTYGNADEPVRGDATMHPLPWVNAAVWVPVGQATEEGRLRFRPAEPTEPMPQHDANSDLARVIQPNSQSANKGTQLKGRLVVTKPWPSMARTVWGDADLAASSGWVGDLDTYRIQYWSTFCADDGEPVLALDLADLARPWGDGSFSVLGHSREELRVGPEGVIIGAAELEAVMTTASIDVVDAIVVALPDPTLSVDGKKTSIPIVCLVLPDGVQLSEELTNMLKMAAHEVLGENCVPADFVRIPAIPRTHNAKPMRNVVQRLFLAESGSISDVSEIANPACLLELKAAIDEWKFQQAAPILDERC